MNDDTLPYAVLLAAMLILPLSALASRRGGVLRTALTWLLVIAVIGVGWVYRGELAQLGTRIDEQFGLGGQTVTGGSVRIRMSPDGHFWARVSLNGVERRMMIDSGATTTAVSEATAREAGLDSGGLPAIIRTANGTVNARQVKVDRVSLDTLTTRNLGVVVSPAFGDIDVLGMNFLSRLKSWRVEGRTLIMETGEPGTPAKS